MHSNSEWPKAVDDFEAFLRRQGLVRQKRVDDEAHFGKLLQSGNAQVALRIIFDRDLWFTQLADLALPEQWYDAPLLFQLLSGRIDDRMPFPEEIRFWEENWQALMRLFEPELRQDSHTRLALLGKERVRRRIPGLI